MRVLELFAGSRSIGKAAESLDMEVFSVDNHPYDNIHLVKDVEFVTKDDIPFIPDIIWASPPCTTYSLAAISHHRHPVTRFPKTEFAGKSDRLVKQTLSIIGSFPGSVWHMENPRATLRKMDFMQGLPLTTVWYCKYGDTRAKPTDIWSNNIHVQGGALSLGPGTWEPRPQCWNGNTFCHHESAKRGSKTGTQGLANAHERGKIPNELCLEILQAAIQRIEPKKQ